MSALKDKKKDLLRSIHDFKLKRPNYDELLHFVTEIEILLEEDIKNDVEKDNNESFLTVEETAERFGVTPQAVYKWIKQNKIEYKDKTPSGGYLIPESQFDGKLLTNKEMNIARETLGTDGTDIDIIDKRDLYGD